MHVVMDLLQKTSKDQAVKAFKSFEANLSLRLQSLSSTESLPENARITETLLTQQYTDPIAYTVLDPSEKVARVDNFQLLAQLRSQRHELFEAMLRERSHGDLTSVDLIALEHSGIEIVIPDRNIEDKGGQTYTRVNLISTKMDNTDLIIGYRKPKMVKGPAHRIIPGVAMPLSTPETLRVKPGDPLYAVIPPIKSVPR